MRADMAKVIVERPRLYGHFSHEPKGWKKQLRKAMSTGDGPPTREGMKRPYRRPKQLNEHLGPLRRYLDSQVGRPWDKVFSEICQHINRSNPVQDHVRDHVEDYVVRHVVVLDGEFCTAGGGRWGQRYGIPLCNLYGHHRWYVCPTTGLLKRVPPRPKSIEDDRPKPPAYVRVSDRFQCRFIDGRWELVTLHQMPEAEPQFCDHTDVVLKERVRHISRDLAKATYGAAVYAVARRIIGKREMKNYPIPVDFIR